MIINTCSAVISFAKQLETDTGKFYEGLAEKYGDKKDIFLSLL